MKVDRYAGGNQAWSTKALTEWEGKMQAEHRAKIIQNILFTSLSNSNKIISFRWNGKKEEVEVKDAT